MSEIKIWNPPTIEIQDTGTPQGAVRKVNFVGSGVVATVSGGVATVTVSGGGGGSANGYFPQGWG